MSSSRTLCPVRSCTDVLAERRVGLFVIRCAAENDAARNDLAFSRHERSQQKRRRLRRSHRGRCRGKAKGKGAQERTAQSYTFVCNNARRHEAGLKACGPPVHTYRARGKGFMVFQTVNGSLKGVAKRQSPPLQRWAESISKVRYERKSPCVVSDHTTAGFDRN